MYLSYLMGADKIEDRELLDLDVEITNDGTDGDRKLIIPADRLEDYFDLLKRKMTQGFWNEVIGADQIVFLFKFEDGSLKRFVLSPENEKEINDLCVQFNNEPPDNTPNVYKYISENNFYHDFMVGHYGELIDRNE